MFDSRYGTNGDTLPDSRIIEQNIAISQMEYAGQRGNVQRENYDRAFSTGVRECWKFLNGVLREFRSVVLLVILIICAGVVTSATRSFRHRQSIGSESSAENIDTQNLDPAIKNETQNVGFQNSFLLSPPNVYIPDICSEKNIGHASGYSKCVQECTPAACCFASDGINCYRYNEETCISYDVCKILSIKSSPNDYKEPVVYGSILTMASQNIEINCGVNEDGIHMMTTKDQYSLCTQECAMASCCVAPSPNHCYFGDNIDICQSYKACEVLDSSFKMLLTNAEQVTLKESCSDDVEAQSNIEGKDCVDLCAPSECCLEQESPYSCSLTHAYLCESTWASCLSYFSPSDTTLSEQNQDSYIEESPLEIYSGSNRAKMWSDMAQFCDGLYISENGSDNCYQFCNAAECCFEKGQSLASLCNNRMKDSCSRYIDSCSVVFD